MNPPNAAKKNSLWAMWAITATVVALTLMLLRSILTGSSSNEAGGLGASMFFLLILFCGPITALVGFSKADKARKSNPQDSAGAAQFIVLAITNLVAFGV